MKHMDSKILWLQDLIVAGGERGIDGHETVQTSSDCECKSVLAWLRGVLRSIGCSSHARHVSIFGLASFPASYDEYTALVEICSVAGEHVRRADSGMYLWWNLDTLTY